MYLLKSKVLGPSKKDNAYKGGIYTDIKRIKIFDIKKRIFLLSLSHNFNSIITRADLLLPKLIFTCINTVKIWTKFLYKLVHVMINKWMQRYRYHRFCKLGPVSTKVASFTEIIIGLFPPLGFRSAFGNALFHFYLSKHNTRARKTRD